MQEYFKKDKERWGDEADQEAKDLNKKLDDDDDESSDMFDDSPKPKKSKEESKT